VSSGPGSDPHLLALLRAIRLRQAAPEAAEAGAADAAAALSGGTPPGGPNDATAVPPGGPNGPTALPPGHGPAALPPAHGLSALPPAPGHAALPPATGPGAQAPVTGPVLQPRVTRPEALSRGIVTGPASPAAGASAPERDGEQPTDTVSPRSQGAAPAEAEADSPRAGADRSRAGERPANVDPIARLAAGPLDPAAAEPLPSAHPSRDVLRDQRERSTPSGIGVAGRATDAGGPRAGLSIPPGGAPSRGTPGTPPSSPAVTPGGTGPAAPAPAGTPVPPGAPVPAVPGSTPAGTPLAGDPTHPPAGDLRPPPANLPARYVPGGLVMPATPAVPATPPVPATPATPPASAVPPAPPVPATPPHRVPAWTPLPHHTASAITPITGASFPVGGVPGLARVERPVPGQHPEPPNPGLRPAAPPATPGVVPPARLGPPGPLLPLPADGMDPADDAALRDVQRLLGSSLALAGGVEEVAERLRAAVLQAQPQLLAALPGNPHWQREQMAQALTWLVQHLDQPPAVASGCAQLGVALAECGVPPQQLQLMGAALAEAMRAGMAAGGWRQDYDQAWRTTWQHVQEWMAHGVAERAYQPAVWTAVVVSHELRRPDLAVVRLRPYLPMPFRAGRYARVEVPELPGVWRPYSLAGVPLRDNIVELHVRAKTHAGVSGALVYRTAVGDRLRFGPAEGAMGVPGHPARDLLLVAGDTGVAPLKAMLAELAETGDRRSAVLFWGVRDLDELYDIEDIADIARDCRRATVVPVVSEGEAGPYASGLVTDAIAAYGEWSEHEVYLAGPPLMLAATSAALQALGVAPERIHHDPQT
jgi:NAD(P)H-flavin reductase/hemoglobin-like flavoprotein